MRIHGLTRLLLCALVFAGLAHSGFNPDSSSTYTGITYSIAPAPDRYLIPVDGSDAENAKIVNLGPFETSKAEEWFFTPADGGLFYIVNRWSGKGMESFVGQYSQKLLRQVTLDEATRQSETAKFSIEPIGTGEWFIKNSDNGEYLENISFFGTTDTASLDGWGRIAIQPVDTFANLPAAPAAGMAQNIPRITNIDSIVSLPNSTERWVIGSVLLPFIFVNDGTKEVSWQAMNSPYYRLIRERFWLRLNLREFPASASAVSETVELRKGASSASSHTVQETLGWKITADAGFSFGALSSSVEFEVSRELQVTATTDTSTYSETSYSRTISWEAGKRFAYASWVLVDAYTLKDMLNRNSATWEVYSETSIIDSYTEGQTGTRWPIAMKTSVDMPQTTLNTFDILGRRLVSQKSKRSMAILIRTLENGRIVKMLSTPREDERERRPGK